MRGWIAFAVTTLAVAIAAAPARAQVWPADGDWQVVYCGQVPAFDPRGDDPAAPGDRDVVGDPGRPAVFIAADDEFVYFRLRVDDEPAVGTDLRPFGWGVEIDLDGRRDGYELLGTVDGIAEPDEVVLGANRTRQPVNDPSDPIEEVLATYEGATHARAVLASGPFASSFGGDPDYFVDWALPFVDLEAAGVLEDTPLVLVFGTSTDASSLDLDLACHDGLGSAPRAFSRASSDAWRIDGVIVIDSDGDGLGDYEEVILGTDPGRADSDGDGYTDAVEVRAGSDPNDARSVPQGVPPPPAGGLRGGPGGWCAATAARGGSPSVALFSALVALALVRRRRSADQSRSNANAI